MNLSEIKSLDSQHFLGVFGERTPVCFVRGEGSTLYDQDGKAYPDLFAGIAVNEKTAPTEADLASSVTIAIGGFQGLVAKAMQ